MPFRDQNLSIVNSVSSILRDLHAQLFNSLQSLLSNLLIDSCMHPVRQFSYTSTSNVLILKNNTCLLNWPNHKKEQFAQAETKTVAQHFID